MKPPNSILNDDLCSARLLRFARPESPCVRPAGNVLYMPERRPKRVRLAAYPPAQPEGEKPGRLFRIHPVFFAELLSQELILPQGQTVVEQNENGPHHQPGHSGPVHEPTR